MLEAIKDVVVEAGGLLKKSFSFQAPAELKAERDFLTGLDLESERIITKRIIDKYPEHNIFSEESGVIDNKADYTWIIDPLCSTNNFVYGIPLYGIAVALVLEGKVILGVICLPEFDQIIWAESGKGAYLNGKKIQVSKRQNLGQALVLYDNQFHKDPRMGDNFSKFTEAALTVRILGSAAYDAALVAMGRVEARIFHKTKIFDFAAASLIVEEAGGQATNFKGEPVELTDSSVVISNRKVHEQILGVLNG